MNEKYGRKPAPDGGENGAGRDKPYQYWLMNVRGVGKRRKILLLQKLGTAGEVYRASEKLLRTLAGEQAAEKILESRKNWNVFTEYEMLCGQKIKFTCCQDPDYPGRLSEIPDAPFALYYQGRLPADEVPSAAIIGARACSEYGVYAAREFGSKLGAAGIQIISGLAMGIDGISQEAALDAGGESFAVMGCGVDICYPKSNRSVYEKCRERGGILSEYPPGTEPRAALFPPRNRLISGFADVVLVIEAREKSGTLITVDMALEQGKEVYALPGRITDSLSRGCNQLFRQGAGVAVAPGDILEVLCGFGSSINIEETARESTGEVLSGREASWINILSEQEMQVYRCLEALPKTAEEIWRQTGRSLTFREVTGTLVELCIKGAARQEPEGYCQKVLAT